MAFDVQLDICLRLIAAAVLSAIVGYNREKYQHPAGLRTQMLIGLGSALFTAISIFAFAGNEHDRVASQIVVGIGFLGAGAIIQSKQTGEVLGLTTAASIWMVAAIGMACGTASYLLAVVSTVLTWFVLAVLGRMEKQQTPAQKPAGVEVDPADPPKRNTPEEPRAHQKES